MKLPPFGVLILLVLVTLAGCAGGTTGSAARSTTLAGPSSTTSVGTSPTTGVASRSTSVAPSNAGGTPTPARPTSTTARSPTTGSADAPSARSSTVTPTDGGPSAPTGGSTAATSNAGATGSGGAPATATPTTTPALTPVTTPPPAPDGFPPGVTTTGVWNASALVAAHSDALAATSYRFTARVEKSRFADDDYHDAVFTRTGTVATARASFLTDTVETDGFEPRSPRRVHDVWANRSTVLTRVEGSNGTRYGAGLRTPGRRTETASLVTESFLVRRTLADGQFSVADVRRTDARTLVTLVSDTYVGRTPAPANVTAFHAALVVDDRGVVHRLNETLATADPTGGRRTTTRYSFGVTTVGPVVTTRPAWARLANDTTASGWTDLGWLGGGRFP